MRRSTKKANVLSELLAQPQTLPGGDLVDELRLAEILGVSRGALSKWRYQGSGPTFVQLSDKLVRYQLKDVQRWLDEKKGKQS